MEKTSRKVLKVEFRSKYALVYRVECQGDREGELYVVCALDRELPEGDPVWIEVCEELTRKPAMSAARAIHVVKAGTGGAPFTPDGVNEGEAHTDDQDYTCPRTMFQYSGFEVAPGDFLPGHSP